MESLGTDLKSEREKRNISLAQIAADTRISLRYLQSLEEDRYGELPGGMYNRAFLRAYCEYLKLDPKAILQRFEAEVCPPCEKPLRPKPHPPRADASFKLHPLVIWSFMLLISAAGLFFSKDWISAVFSPYFFRPPVTRTPNEPVQQPQVALSDDGRKAPAPIAPSTPVAATENLNADIAAQTPSTGSLRLELEVFQKCWISINSDGRRAVEMLLKPGDDQSFDAVERFYIILGNAGGVHLKINGRPAKPLGKPGEVIKMQINEQNVKDLLEKTTG